MFLRISVNSGGSSSARTDDGNTKKGFDRTVPKRNDLNKKMAIQLFFMFMPNVYAIEGSQW